MVLAARGADTASCVFGCITPSTCQIQASHRKPSLAVALPVCGELAYKARLVSNPASTSHLDVLELAERPHRAVAKLAAPTVFAMLLQSAVNEIDVVFFSRLAGVEASNAQAALLPSLIMVWLFGGSLSAISVGTQAHTARRYAEKNYDAAGAVLVNSAAFCLIAGVLFSLLGWVSIKWLLGRMIKVPEVLDIAYDYSRWRLLGIVSMAMTIGVKSFFDGIGRTHVHLVASIVMNIFNVLLCWMFIFGELGAPRMGAPGAGLGAFVSTWIGLLIVLVYAWRERKTFRPLRRSNLSSKLTWDLVKLSAPAALATIVMMAGFGVFASFAGRLDTMAAATQGGEAVNGAATTNIVALMKLTFTACLAFGTATATLVGQSMGVGRSDLATRFGWASVRVGVAIFGVVGLCQGILFTQPIIAFITHSVQVQEVMVLPLRIMGTLTPVIAVAMILSEALFGAGSTGFVAVAQLILVFCVLVFSAWLLSLAMGMGLIGMWLAAGLYSVCAAITMSVKFAGGSWKKIQL